MTMIADYLIESVISHSIGTTTFFGQYVNTADGLGVVIGKQQARRGYQPTYTVQLVTKGERRAYAQSELQPWLVGATL